MDTRIQVLLSQMLAPSAGQLRAAPPEWGQICLLVWGEIASWGRVALMHFPQCPSACCERPSAADRGQALGIRWPRRAWQVG